MEILKLGLRNFGLFIPGLVTGVLMLRLGRHYQLSSEGKTWRPAKDAKDAAKRAEGAKTWKGLGLIFTGALTIDAWWNAGVIPGIIVTLVFLAEIRIVLGWRKATPPHGN